MAMTCTKILIVLEFEKGILLAAGKSEIWWPNLCTNIGPKKKNDVSYVVCFSFRKLKINNFYLILIRIILVFFKKMGVEEIS